MILENGVIRTMDPALPRARALAIAADRVAGGVGTHETALPSPDVVDLGGRCVLPGFTDSHVHFPTWSLSRRDVRLEGVSGLAEALEPRTGASAARHVDPRDRLALGGVGGAAHRGRPRCGDRRRARAALLQGLPLGLAQHGGARHALPTTSRWRVAWSSGTRAASRPGSCARSPRGSSARRYAMPPEDEFVDATREGLRIAASRGVVAIHDKDGWLGAPRIFQRIAERDGLTLRVWQSVPYERLPELEALTVRSGIGDDFLRIGYLKAFMDGTLGSQTAWMLDGSGVVITQRRGACRGDPRGRRAWAGPSACTRSATGRTAKRSTRSSRRATSGRPSACGIASSTPSASRRRTSAASRHLGVACSVQFSHAPSDRDLAERFWPEQVDGAYAFRSLWESGALVANGSDAPVEELDPLAGVRAGVLRTIDDRPAWHPEQCLTIEQALVASTVTPAWLSRDERRRGKLLPGYLADLVVLSRDPLECPPDELETVEVVATMVGGRWVHNPPPWD